jgi:hypothetical protein
MTLSANDIFHKPLGYLASGIRSSVENLGTREQIEALAALSEETVKKGYAPMFGDSTMHLVTFSDWSKARFFDLDFSAAVLKNNYKDQPNKPVIPSLVLASGFVNEISVRNSFPSLERMPRATIGHGVC